MDRLEYLTLHRKDLLESLFNAESLEESQYYRSLLMKNSEEMANERISRLGETKMQRIIHLNM